MISTSVLIPTLMEVDFHSQKKEKHSAETLPAVIVMPPSVIVAPDAPALVAQEDVLQKKALEAPLASRALQDL